MTDEDSEAIVEVLKVLKKQLDTVNGRLRKLERIAKDEGVYDSGDEDGDSDDDEFTH
jgi:hypothetical protein